MNDLSPAFDIAASGMAAQRFELDVIAQNLANANTARAADGGPYRTRTAVFEAAPPFSDALSAALDSGLDIPFDFQEEIGVPTGVRLASVAEQDTPPQYHFDPGNPAAASSGPRKGFVALPDVDPIGQMVALVTAGRAYDADVSVLQAAKQMEIETTDIGRP
ncbi:MAG: flagellar basal body rod protein FlgC [Candidatus Eremiobacteraeota bacterium]|nr:flagellar basal body rod protein FlgC [Candidatus Eremiobacteraeota bacterium]MBC5827246.1 flagellar basal body rod protein FlgC [Candidatus Eremiobacteraeota bacterium]